jgi:hypothetical protein
MFPRWHAFTPQELESLLDVAGFEVEHWAAPGTLSRFVDPARLTQLMRHVPSYERFLDFEQQYDSDSHLLGVGAIGAAGLLATAARRGVAE